MIRSSVTYLSTSRFSFLIACSRSCWIILVELDAYAVHAMSLICGCLISLALEHVSEVTATIAANDFRSRHAKCSVSVSSHCAWNGIEICRPPAATLELMLGLIDWCIAACACVDSLVWVVFVVLASEWCFSTFLTQNAELLYSMLVSLAGNGLGSYTPLFRTARHSSSLR